jgi:hypothetical protein
VIHQQRNPPPFCFMRILKRAPFQTIRLTDFRLAITLYPHQYPSSSLSPIFCQTNGQTEDGVLRRSPRPTTTLIRLSESFSKGKNLSCFFAIPLFLGFLGIAVGVYTIHRGEKLKEGEKVGGLGIYWDRTGFMWNGAIALAFGVALLSFAFVSALYM